jgi:hypothetical protein
VKVLELVPWNYIFTCKGCQSKLEAESTDVRRGDFGRYDEHEHKFYVECEVCKVNHIIPDSKIPQDVKNLAMREAMSHKG